MYTYQVDIVRNSDNRIVASMNVEASSADEAIQIALRGRSSNFSARAHKLG